MAGVRAGADLSASDGICQDAVADETNGEHLEAAPQTIWPERSGSNGERCGAARLEGFARAVLERRHRQAVGADGVLESDEAGRATRSRIARVDVQGAGACM